MALFTFGKKDANEKNASMHDAVTTATAKKSAPKQKKVAKAAATSTHISAIAQVLRNPRITEKATMQGEVSAYLFDVARNATKREIAQAVSTIYKVTPRMVRVVTVPAKKKRNARTGKTGIKPGGKKAYVYLMKGETITLA